MRLFQRKSLLTSLRHSSSWRINIWAEIRALQHDTLSVVENALDRARLCKEKNERHLPNVIFRKWCKFIFLSNEYDTMVLEILKQKTKELLKIWTPSWFVTRDVYYGSSMLDKYKTSLKNVTCCSEAGVMWEVVRPGDLDTLQKN